MADNTRLGLFGVPSPEDVRKKIGRVQESDIALASLNPLNIPIAMASQQARDVETVVGEGLFGSPEARKYKAISQVMKQTPFDPEKPHEYYKNLARGFNNAGFMEPALQALDQAQRIERDQAKMMTERGAMEAAQINASANIAKANTALNRALRESKTGLAGVDFKNLPQDVKFLVLKRAADEAGDEGMSTVIQRALVKSQTISPKIMDYLSPLLSKIAKEGYQSLERNEKEVIGVISRMSAGEAFDQQIMLDILAGAEGLPKKPAASTKQTYTKEQEDKITRNMKHNNMSREEVIAKLKELGKL